MKLSPLQRLLRTSLKRVLYAQIALRDASLVLRGKAKPLVRFTVEASPPSVYFNFAIRPDQAPLLRRELALPEGFELVPVACLEGEQPFLCLTLNVYRVSGLVRGLRAEWSVYVRTSEDATPRYMIIEAVCDGASLDPVDLVTQPGLVEHRDNAGEIVTRVGATRGGVFSAKFRAPQQGERALPARTWIEANDLIYWRNGVHDRAFYGGGLANARMTVVDPSACVLQDTSPYAMYLEPRPRHIVVFSEPIEFVISPWWNL